MTDPLRPAPQDASAEITQMLRDLRHQPVQLRERLYPLMYDAMKQIARRQLRAEGRLVTLQPTALVNEAYLRLADASLDWNSRAHFLACASRAMREVLVDAARRRRAQKRAVLLKPVLLDEIAVERPLSLEDVLTVHETLDRFKELDPLKADLLELKIFGGLTIEEAAEVLGVGRTSAKQHFRLARAWMHRELGTRSKPS